MKLKLQDKGSVDVAEAAFGAEYNEALVHQVVTAYLAGARAGTKAQKNRSAARGGGAKPWRQKGTGRARQGSIRAAQWRGGAVVFGPQPRSYRTDVPKALRRLAIRSALNARALEGSVAVIEPLSIESPRTKAIIELLEALEAGGNVLLLTDGLKREVYLSGRNVPSLLVKPWGEVSAYDILWSDLVIVEESALSGEEE